jgi:hypothetical protein
MTRPDEDDDVRTIEEVIAAIREIIGDCDDDDDDEPVSALEIGNVVFPDFTGGRRGR